MPRAVPGRVVPSVSARMVLWTYVKLPLAGLQVPLDTFLESESGLCTARNAGPCDEEGGSAPTYEFHGQPWLL